VQHTVANNGNKLSIRAGCYTIRYVCTVRVHSNSATSEKGALRHRMLSTLSRSSLFLSLSHSFLFSFPATALVTNNRSSGIYFITTRVSMPARLVIRSSRTRNHYLPSIPTGECRYWCYIALHTLPEGEFSTLDGRRDHPLVDHGTSRQ